MSTPDVLPAWETRDGAARARELFAHTFGGEAAGVWSAPGRVNVIGEHTDYNGGLALPIALPHRTYLAVAPRADRALRVVSASAEGIRELDLDAVGPVGTPGEVPGWPAYVAGVAWAMEQPGGPAEQRPLPGLDVAVVSCVPSGGGLSSSAALECAAAIAWDEIAGLGLIRDGAAPTGDVADAESVDAGRAALAQLCVRAENEVAGAPTGGMDQAASLRAQPGHALLLDCRDGAIEHVPFDLAAAGLEMLVIDTRAAHSHVDGGYGQRRATCEEAVAVLGVADLREVAEDVASGATELDSVLERLETDEQRMRVRHVVTEIQRVKDLAELLRGGGLTAGDGAVTQAAGLLDASHVSMRDDYEISAPELDLAVSTAQAAGAHGARMTGGGFGGSAIAIVDSNRAEAVRAEIAKAFAEAGFRDPGFLPAVAAAPASRAD